MSRTDITPKGVWTLGIGTMLFGIFLLLIAIKCGEGASFVSGGIFVFSSGLALLGCSFALGSSVTAKATANVDFLIVTNMLEDARTYFNSKMYNPELFGHKTKNCIIMAVELLERDEKNRFIKKEYQDKLFEYFNISLKHFINIPSWRDEEKGLGAFISSYAKLERYYDTPRKKEFDKFFLDAELKNDKEEFLQQVAKAQKNLN